MRGKYAAFVRAAIRDAITKSDRPLRQRDLMELIDDNGDHYRLWQTICAQLTHLYRTGELARQKHGAHYAYYIPNTPAPIQPGYTWYDKHGPIRIMAVADGYAMCRRPGAQPFVVSIKEVQNASASTPAPPA